MCASLDRLQELARAAIYEPDRGLEDDAPAPVRGEAREMLARLGGRRLYYVADEHGELCGFGVMEPGGNIRNISVGLYARAEIAGETTLLRLLQ